MRHSAWLRGFKRGRPLQGAGGLTLAATPTDYLLSWVDPYVDLALGNWWETARCPPGARGVTTARG